MPVCTGVSTFCRAITPGATTSTRSALPSNFLICALMMSVISDDLPAMRSLLAARHLAREVLKPRLKGRVDEPIPQLHSCAADERGIHLERRADLLPAGLLEAAHQLVTL